MTMENQTSLAPASDASPALAPAPGSVLRARYGCTLGPGGWCDGKPVGSRMRCPHHSLTKARERTCAIGIDRTHDEMDEAAHALGTQNTEASRGA